MKVYDNSANYVIHKNKPLVIYGVGYREKGEPKNKDIFLTWQTQSLSTAMKIISDLKTRKVYTGIDWCGIVLVKQSMELVETIKEGDA